MNDSSFSNSLSGQDTTVLCTKKMPVIPQETLKVGIVMAGIGQDAQNPQAFICQIELYDDKYVYIDEDYRGSIRSNDKKNAVYIPSSTDPTKASWSNQEVSVPNHARYAVLRLYAGDMPEAKPISDILCVNLIRIPVFSSIVHLDATQAYFLDVAFVQIRNRKKIALVSFTFYDVNSRKIEEDVAGLTYSQRYSYFRYIGCDDKGVGSKTVFIPPNRTVYVHIQIHSLIENSSLEVCHSSILKIEPNLSNALANSDFLFLTDQCTEIDVDRADLKNHNIVYVARVQYLNSAAPNAAAGSISLPSSNLQEMKNLPDCKPQTVQLSGTNLHVGHKHIYLKFSPEETRKQLKVSSSNNVVSFIYRHVSLCPLSASSNSEHEQVEIFPEREIKRTFEVSPFWIGAIQIDIPKTYAIEWALTYFTENNERIGEIEGTLNNNSYEVSEYPTHQISWLCDTDTCRSYIIEFRPGKRSRACSVKLRTRATEPISISYKIYSFVRPDEDKLKSTLPLYGKSILKGKLPHEVVNLLLEPIQYHPNNAGAHLTSLLWFVRLGDELQAQLLATKVLRTFKDRIACKLARNVQALLDVLEHNWLPAVTAPTSKPRHIKHRPRSLRVALLLGINTNNPEIERVSSWAKLLKKPKTHISVVMPIGAKKRGSGARFSVETVCELVHYYPDCVTPLEFKFVPLNSQLDFATLLTSLIMQHDKSNMIHVPLSQGSLTEVLVGESIAQQANIPILFEITEWPSRVFLESENFFESVFLQNLHSKFMEIMRKADALVVHSDKFSNELISRGVIAERIFILPQQLGDGYVNDGDTKPCKELANFYGHVYQFIHDRFYSARTDADKTKHFSC